MGICADKSKELAAEYEICAKQYGCDFLDAGPFVKMNQIDFMHLESNSALLYVGIITLTFFSFII